MISVRIDRDDENRIKSFICEGHAGYKMQTEQFDLVCASVSAIIYTALGYMEEYYKFNDFEEKNGFIKWQRPDVSGIETGVLVNISTATDAMAVGLKQIEMQYGKYIKVLDGYREV